MPQSYTCLHYHLIFSTKNRVPVIAAELEPRLYEYVGGIIRAHKGTLIAAGGMPDHVHLLCSLSKELALADALRLIKTNSSKWVHETFADQQGFAWQAGYGAFAVSYSNLDSVKQYILQQKEHHHRLSYQEEFVTSLKRHNISFEEKYLWE
jgi:REP element-mobilizing transposase RayT